jgi:signal transduction histidine kinase
MGIEIPSQHPPGAASDLSIASLTERTIDRLADNSAPVIAERQLFKAHRLRTLESVVARVAHDFNNLILAMRGNVALATLDQHLTAEVQARLQSVDDAAVRATELSRQLLSCGRSSAEKTTGADFNQIVGTAVDLAKKIHRGRIRVDLVLPATPVKVQIDPARGTQALVDLCLNAFEAMPNGGTLTITNEIVPLSAQQRLKCRSKSSSQFMRCVVADTGVGIDRDILPRIFDPSFTTKKAGDGVGLGLYIVSSGITNAGGFIEIDSALGRGTAVSVYLPLDSGPGPCAG